MLQHSVACFHLNLQTAAHHTREMTAAEAAHKLLALAIRADKLKDDVTGRRML